jgi:predicted nucleotidyltransferase
MTISERVQDICDRIARAFRPEKIVVFGSHAYGEPGPFSDLDLLVVMPFEGSPLQQAARIISRINPAMGVDLIVRTPAQVRERLAMPDAFMREIMERGRVAYEADHNRVDRQGGR